MTKIKQYYKTLLSILLFLSCLIYISENTTRKKLRSTNKSKLKIFCIILTTKEHLKDDTKIVFYSWAYKCDDHVFVSKLPNSNNSKVKLNFLISYF